MFPRARFDLHGSLDAGKFDVFLHLLAVFLDEGPVLGVVVFRPTSGGSALLSEIVGVEDMITMFHLDNDRVLMTHYCGAGNQPRMQATMASAKLVHFWITPLN